MQESVVLGDPGRVASEIVVVRDGTGSRVIRKSIWRLPEFDKERWESPDPSTYNRLVGGSIQLITDPTWGFRTMLPAHITYRLETTPISTSGYQAIIEMDFIDGQPISSIGSLSLDASSQLSVFIRGSTTMAATTRKESGKILLPDLLGGVAHPYDTFQNFIVEKGTGKVYFVDVYPLAEVPRRLLIPRGLDIIGTRPGYLHHLMLAAQATASDNVIAATRKLVQTIQGN